MNAIILAAGVGLRMRDVAQRGHKAFLTIGGISIIERTIRYLHEADIYDITIVVGHKRELFKVLEDKYGVQLVVNRKYSTNNNLHSLELVLDKIGDTFIIHGDVVLFKNIFKQEENHTFFYTIYKKSRGIPLLHPVTNKQRLIEGVETYAGGDTVTTLLGISYWSKEDVHHLRTFYENCVTTKLKKKFHCEWDHEVVKLYDTFPIEAHQIDRKYAKDINLMRDYLGACYIYDQLWKK